MICIDEEEWSGDAARKMLDTKVRLLVFMVDIYHTCSISDRPIVKMSEHVCPHLCVVMCYVISVHLP